MTTRKRTIFNFDELIKIIESRNYINYTIEFYAVYIIGLNNSIMFATCVIEIIIFLDVASRVSFFFLSISSLSARVLKKSSRVNNNLYLF